MRRIITIALERFPMALKISLFLLGLILALAPRARAAADSSSVAALSSSSSKPRNPWQGVFKWKNDFAAIRPIFSDPALVSVFRAGARYRLPNDYSVGLFQEIEYLNPKGSRRNPYSAKDAFLYFSKRNLWSNPYAWQIDLHTRLYLPTGERTRNYTKQQAAGYVWFDFIKQWDRITLNPQLIGLYRSQSQNFYLDEKRKKKANNAFEASPTVFVIYTLTPRLSVWHSIGMEYVWSHKISGPGKDLAASWTNETGFSYEVVKNGFLSPSIGNAALFDSRMKAQLYREREMAYHLVLEWKI